MPVQVREKTSFSGIFRADTGVAMTVISNIATGIRRIIATVIGHDVRAI
jgi:hypothetical protein